MSNREVSNTKLKTQRTSLKRKITLVVKALSGLVEQRGSKTRIRQFIDQLEGFIIEAEKLNEDYISTLPDIEHEQAYQWYDEVFNRVNEIISDASLHLDLREDSGSIDTAVSTNIRTPDVSNEAKARAKAAEVFAKKQREFQKQKEWATAQRINLERRLLEAKQRAANVELDLEMHHIISEEASKTQKLETEAACLGAEALLTNEKVSDIDDLDQRLKDFEEFGINISGVFSPATKPFYMRNVCKNSTENPKPYVLTPPGAFVKSKAKKVTTLFHQGSDKTVTVKPEKKCFSTEQ